MGAWMLSVPSCSDLDPRRIQRRPEGDGQVSTATESRTANVEYVEVTTTRVHNLHHVEVFTPKPDESLELFTQVLGLHETHAKASRSSWGRRRGGPPLHDPHRGRAARAQPHGMAGRR